MNMCVTIVALAEEEGWMMANKKKCITLQRGGSEAYGTRF